MGVVDFEDDVSVDISTAHPQDEPDTRRTLSYSASFGRQCTYKILGVAAGVATLREVVSCNPNRTSYRDSFGMSERYVILPGFS